MAPAIQGTQMCQRRSPTCWECMELTRWVRAAQAQGTALSSTTFVSEVACVGVWGWLEMG